jgi:acetate CoA/acetoacetate CoA-transferase beta subunit
MDLVSGTRRVIVAMIHSAKGEPKILSRCTLPLTSSRPISLLVTELAVIEPSPEGLVLKEVAPNVSVDQVVAATRARLIIPPVVPAMAVTD